MAVIRIEEIEKDDGSVEIKVDGVLDRKSRDLLDEVYRRHLKENKNIILNMEGMTHVTREGREFLGEIRDTVSFTEMPSFILYS